jgi:hypothetical protein
VFCSVQKETRQTSLSMNLKKKNPKNKQKSGKKKKQKTKTITKPQKQTASFSFLFIICPIDVQSINTERSSQRSYPFVQLTMASLISHT